MTEKRKPRTNAGRTIIGREALKPEAELSDDELLKDAYREAMIHHNRLKRDGYRRS